ncbi:flagellar hook assembly protein FlgD [Paenibacillus sp. NFR01]|uniref:flagellar hook assembly protein FlgD n=1 Tax=Paenibacillus sp. NFR01 TaxID=1566279 RepID=UPI0008AFF792|nr:flagellar hook assembly protein FlgD [Paenibacillus sp. NFR01]SET43661.1 flagellar basal-body rod modification protein FlgD [Paenibacillus sp. NFR01]
MASTTPISTSDSWNYTAPDPTKKTTGSSTLGKDQFLKILITQLQNQDPMQPMEDKEFIAQMAQFTSVEQLMNISTQLTAMNQSLGSVSGLIGKTVSWTDADTELPKSGIVDSIVVSNGSQYAVVGDDRILLTDITQIQNATGDDGKESGAKS